MAEVIYKDVRTENDIQDLYKMTGTFHDSCIDFCEYQDNTLCLRLDTWGRGIELVFVGSVACSINLSFLVERGDPDWRYGTIVIEDGLVYLYEGGTNKTIEEIKCQTCWFCGRELKYRWMPKE